MGHDVSSWFVDQTRAIGSEPKRVFKIGTSDYSDRVTKWPSIKRVGQEIKSVNPRIPLSNVDGKFNLFFENTYLMPNTCTLEMGFTHPESGDELITVFTGYLKSVKYPKKECSILMKDRLWDFTQITVGESDIPIEFTEDIPSDIAWTLCTCYGGLSTDSATNPDINYTSFQEWAGILSRDNIVCDAYYEGLKITEALSNLAKITDSAIWIEGDGKINFKRFSNASSLDMVLTIDDEIIDLTIDVDSQRLINKQGVAFNFSPESDYFQDTLYYQDSTSVNTYGLNEELFEDETIWFTNEAHAKNLAQRKVAHFKDPPKMFNIKTPLVGIHRVIGETIRLVDSFYNQTSADAWTIKEYEYQMQNDTVNYVTDGAATLIPFILDVSTLDQAIEVLI